MVEVLDALKNQIRQTLAENLVAMFLTGSRVRGEEREGSDYDIAIIVSRVDEGTILGLRAVFADRRGYSVYLLDKNDLKTMPKPMLLQFVHSEKLYGDLDYPLPSGQEIQDYINIVRRNWLDRIRHYLILPHPHEKPASALLPALKSVYLCLSCLVYKDTGNLPLTRNETVSLIEKQKSGSLGVNLIRILGNWDSYHEQYMQDPLLLLLQIETFFRTLQV